MISKQNAAVIINFSNDKKGKTYFLLDILHLL